MSDVDELRLASRPSTDCPERAVTFLSATTVEELEAQAGALARLIGASHVEDPPQAEPLAGILANAGAEKARRQQALVEALHGPRPQPRDESGRFAGFDGGARRQVPLQSPAEEHNALLGELALLSGRAPLREPPFLRAHETR